MQYSLRIPLHHGEVYSSPGQAARKTTTREEDKKDAEDRKQIVLSLLSHKLSALILSSDSAMGAGWGTLLLGQGAVST